jgi:hypothetical protein
MEFRLPEAKMLFNTNLQAGQKVYLHSQDEFYLSDIFPEDTLIALELILPARLPKRPMPAEKTTFPLVRPEDVIRRRTMKLVKCS